MQPINEENFQETLQRRVYTLFNGPFYIYEILDNKSYKLRLDDKILAKIAHRDRLKYYHFRNNSEPLISQIGIHSPLINPKDIVMLAETPFETEKESYQTSPVFDLFSSKSEHSTQTATPEPMANNSMQQNILIALQGIQTALGQRNNSLLLLFRSDAQDPIEWLDNFKRAIIANQYNNKYKFQIVGGYLQGSFATWFLQETNANA
ncbi:hypothetical protein G9A89_021276 [Geosiphon pyriformis]|nr:hypothetical protein G9A89_021276 [Geosiphon pyriformis]